MVVTRFLKSKKTGKERNFHNEQKGTQANMFPPWGRGAGCLWDTQLALIFGSILIQQFTLGRPMSKELQNNWKKINRILNWKRVLRPWKSPYKGSETPWSICVTKLASLKNCVKIRILFFFQLFSPLPTLQSHIEGMDWYLTQKLLWWVRLLWE